MRRCTLLATLLAAALLACSGLVLAHDGPPFPIVSNQLTGPYDISIWTDPDTTDDGTPAGQFWVLVEPRERGGSIPAGTTVTVAINPLDRQGPTRRGRAEPVNGSVGRQFVALLMDHEGPFGVQATVEGPLGRAGVEGRVDATYDLRPSRTVLLVYLLPFVAIAALWVKVLLRRRRQGPAAAR